MKKILIVDHFSQAPGEAGNNRYVYLAKMLCGSGYEVEIVTTDFMHIGKKTRHIEKHLIDSLPYKYTMLPEPGYAKNVSLKRFYSHYVFGRNLRKYLETINKPDVVLAAVPSLDAGTAAADYCEKYNVPFIADIQDLWPEAFKLVVNIPVVSTVAFTPMMRQAKKIYSKADRILAVSDIYKERGVKDCIKDKDGMCIYLGADFSAYNEHSKNATIEKPEGQIWIIYVGTLGHSYNIDIVIDALDSVAEHTERDFVFKVLGDGPYMEKFKEHASRSKVRIDFLGRVDYSLMAAYLSASDIAVNPIVKGAAQSIINKHADYAAGRLPVVNTQECPEYRNLLTKYECGINCGVESVQDVANALTRLINDDGLRRKMGNNSRMMADECFNRKNTYRKFIDEIERLTN